MPKALIAAALSLAVAGPASGLSCLKPDIVAAFSDAAAADEVYVIVSGRFSDGPGPRDGGTTGGEPRSYEAFFSGWTIFANGPEERINEPVRVFETCTAEWCAELPMDTEVLTFLQRDPDGGKPTLVLNACQGNLFPEPTEAMMEAITTCFAKGCTAS